jgi:hypothetical protein
MEFIEKTVCDDCPCRNIDYEQGSHCNIGYNMEYEVTEDKEWVSCSDNCGLKEIVYDGGSFKPTEKRKVTPIHPNNW